MPKVICQQCRTREIVTGRYMCRECEDQMTGRAPKPPKSESPSSGNGYSSASMPCRECSAALNSDDQFCPSCGSSRPRAASGRPSSAQAPPREDQTYQDPLFVGGVYRCPRCNAVLEAGSRRCAACGVMFMNPVPEAPRSSARGSTPKGGSARPNRFCHTCGSGLAPNDTFCSSCGAEQRASDTEGPASSSPNTQERTGGSASGRRSGPSTSGQTAPRPPQERAASAVQSIVSKRWFWPAWNGLSTAWSLAIIGMAVCGVWIVISAAIHHFQGAGMNGVYEASDGPDYVTFWSNGTYQTNFLGLSTTGKYEIMHDGSVDMLVQYRTELHPGPNASADAQGAALFGNMFASGMGKAILSTDKNTFQWRGQTYSYFGKPTTGPPAMPDQNTAQPNSSQ